MFFNLLRTVSFRNLSDKEIFTGAKDVFLVGENGQGKSNFLEALYFCAYASSFRVVRDSEIAYNGKKDFCAQVNLSESVHDDILVKIENGKKSILINGKNVNDRKEMLSITPCIVFCHEDMEFVNGSPERRRWFFDQSLSLYDPVYLEDLRRYRRVLKSRNSLLKDFSQRRTQENPDKVLDALDPQLVMYGLKLMEKRKKAVKDFADIFQPLYEEVCGIGGISVLYTQSWKEKTEQDIVAHLKQKRQAEMAAGLSLSGPHRDRYVFTQNSQGNITDFTVRASTGQRRLLALLLRTAQACLYSSQTKQNPVLLLDDVLLEMDGQKRRKFLSVLPAYDQAFYTFLPEEPYQQYKKPDTLIYTVKEGELYI
ncbi:MAG: DNA replication and repair protein RecF [Treponema sp.]|nr:DNA replication and repair protein RecF [Treponema sp.]